MSSYIKYEQLVSEVLGSISNPRTKDILSLRFGLKDGQRKTLEAIGRKHGITRERVRQVEEAAFSELKKPAVVKYLQPAFNSIDRSTLSLQVDLNIVKLSILPNN